MSSGIYEIQNQVSGHRYIGQSANIDRRWYEHRKTLRRGHSHQPHLQNAWNKYGEQAFKFSVLGLCAPKHLTFFEQAWMDARKPEYNKAPAAGSPLGIKRSAETREKVAAANRGKKHSPETIAKRAATLLGNTHTKGHKLSAEHKAKISAATRGRKLTPEHCAKVSAALKGNTNSCGYKHSPEIRAKLCVVAKAREERRRQQRISG